MKKIQLIKNPELFQGKKQLYMDKEYFEGWYYKNTSSQESIAFIPGISINPINKHAFIQIMTLTSSYYITYDIKDFHFSSTPFCIQIKNNIFTKEIIIIDIKNQEQNLNISGHIHYKSVQNLHHSLFQPNIMGPFSYLSFLECYHAILSMKSMINGVIYINGKKIQFENGDGYIEKDWGYSFPKSYIWSQANSFLKTDASFMISIAHIPFYCFSFKGLICVLIVNDKEYRFSTYNNAKIIQFIEAKNSIDITLQKGNYQLDIQAKSKQNLELLAPVQGNMKKEIFESLLATTTITLKKDHHIIFHDTSPYGGLEIVE